MQLATIIGTALALLLLAAGPISLLAAPTRVEREAGADGSSDGSTGTESTTLRWHEPCAGSSPVATDVAPPEDYTPPPFVARDHYHEIRRRAILSENQTRALKRRYVIERTKDEDIEKSLEDVNLDGIPKIPHVVMGTPINVTELLHRVHDWLVRFAVFMEQMRLDEFQRHEDYGYSFLEDVKTLEEKAIYWLLCKITLTLHGHNSSPESSITRELISHEYKNRERAYRNMKNIIVLRDLEQALLHLKVAMSVVLQAES